ncbi:MAG TPA: glycosyltransferase [Marmoricola sp.]|nr:glycosyltransferase [Marmoricola sp.]
MSIEQDIRPWGRYEVVDHAAAFQVKRISVLPGQRLSYQRHRCRAEHWFVVSGFGVVTIDDVERPVGPLTTIDIPAGVAHRVANAGEEELVFIEVQTGTYFGEDDIERLDDDYGRDGRIDAAPGRTSFPGQRAEVAEPIRSAAEPPATCVVVPTRNEAGNVAPLVERVSVAFGPRGAEVLFVDDSDDETPRRVESLGRRSPIPVHLVHRAPGKRDGGLGSAVLAGLRRASAAGATWAVVMDGDLQHPPEVAPLLVARGERLDADVVVASRYVGEGSAAGLGGASRELVSGGATRLAKWVFPRRLRSCSDPMSGFFAVRLASLDLDRLQPQGFKILLEILAGSEGLRVAEVPFAFAERHSGESKASWREGRTYLRRLLGLRLAGRAGSVVKFGAAGATGIVANSAALWLLVSGLGTSVALGAVLATQVSTIWNFALTDALVFPGRKSRPWWQRFTGFAAVNNAVLLLRLPLLAWLVAAPGLHYVAANVITLVAAFAVRYVVSDLLLFTTRRNMTITARSSGIDSPTTHRRRTPQLDRPHRSGPTDVTVDLRRNGLPVPRVRHSSLAWHYDIHGLLTVGSVVRLDELEAFRTELTGPCDIEIRRGHFGNRPLRARARVTQYAAAPAVAYEEHLGRLGTDFLVQMGDSIQVTVGPLLVASPHVLYTNVVEALLRFVLVSRDMVLLHSACLDLDGSGVLLSARTDTGKTGTVLRLLREGHTRFLSDDMTILAADGSALSFPKSLTISQHTLRAVDAGDLSRAEWRRLRLQSRLHSKEGRGVGAWLGERNLPIMSLNAVTQWVVPPPKYPVQRLVPCDVVSGVRVSDLFVIERGEHRVAPIAPDDLVDELIENTDDAYGFPPFRYFAPALEVAGRGYEELRAHERLILTRAMEGVVARRLATPDFSWWTRIADLAGPDAHVRAPEW